MRSELRWLHVDQFERYRRAQVRIIIRQLDMGLRFASGGCTFFTSVSRLRSLALARKTYDFVSHMCHHLLLKSDEVSTITRMLEALQRAIELADGQQFPNE